MKFNLSYPVTCIPNPTVKVTINGDGANLIQSPGDYLTAKLIFEEAINFQKALVKRDQSILRN